MTIRIETRVEPKRGCGYRKPGGLYLVSPALNSPCCKLPLPLTVCPCCGAGFKPSRGWTWIDADALFWTNEQDTPRECTRNDDYCPLAKPGIGRAGLIWVGEQYYPTVDAFLSEAAVMGVSRRIFRVPRGFEIGRTMVFLAHKKAIATQTKPRLPGLPAYEWTPAIFAAFRPTLEYVVSGDEDEETLERIMKRGIVLVDVKPATPLFAQEQVAI